MLTLDHARVGRMTGWELLETLGHNHVGNRHNTTFRTQAGEWRCYQTRGRGRKAKSFYVHLWKEIEVTVVDHEGRNTDCRHKGYIHFRGTTYDRIADMAEVI